MNQPSPPTVAHRRIRWRRAIVVLAVLAILGFNGLAYALAWATTHFARTGSPDDYKRLTNWGKVCRFSRDFSLPRPMSAAKPGRWARATYTTEHYPGSRNQTLEAWRVPGEKSHPAVLLFHGYNAGKSSLDSPAAEFHALGCETWMVDFHGSGGSSGQSTTVGYDEAEDVAATFRLAREKQSEKTPVILYGSSMGSAAILCAVHRFHLEPDALILECPYDRLVTTIGNRCHMLGLPAFPAADLMVFWGGVQGGFNGFALNPVEYAREVRCPALLMQGDLDERVGLSHAKEIAAAFGEHGTFKVFAGAGHTMMVHHAPGEWRESVMDFLAKNRLLTVELPHLSGVRTDAAEHVGAAQ